MARWFDRYYGPDLVVGRPQEAQRTFEQKLGIPAGQNMRMTMHGNGFDVAYLQLNEDFDLSASCIQLMGIRPLARDEPHDEFGRMLRPMLLAYITAQRLDRPVVAHVQALSASTQDDVDAIGEMLKSRGVPHVALMNNIYVGLVEENGRFHYDPSADAGTYLEWAPSVQKGFPGFVLPPTLPDNPTVAQLDPGTWVGPVARTQIVPSIDAVIDRFRWMMDWPEEGDVEYVDGPGQRSVILKPKNGLSAVWEFIEPTRPDSRAGRFLERFGEGPWAIRLGVFGLDAKLADLEARGTRWKEIEPDGNGARRVALNRWDVHGVGFEVEDLPVVYRGVGQGRSDGS
jgi:hypothetical protein